MDPRYPYPDGTLSTYHDVTMSAMASQMGSSEALRFLKGRFTNNAECVTRDAVGEGDAAECFLLFHAGYGWVNRPISVSANGSETATQQKQIWVISNGCWYWIPQVHML